jgi:hypothetical protein
MATAAPHNHPKPKRAAERLEDFIESKSEPASVDEMLEEVVQAQKDLRAKWLREQKKKGFWYYLRWFRIY